VSDSAGLKAVYIYTNSFWIMVILKDENIEIYLMYPDPPKQFGIAFSG
jgi:hypothetical protein